VDVDTFIKKFPPREGYTYRDIAYITGKEPGSVRSKVTRLRKEGKVFQAIKEDVFGLVETFEIIQAMGGIREVQDGT
jgi:hypothetical protein